MKNAIKIIICALALSAQSFAQCDYEFQGPTGGTVNSGETGCLIDDLSGSVTVQPGGILRVCGEIEITGAVTINANGYSTPGKVILAAGADVHVSSGSWTFNDAYQLEYDGDPTCNARIYKTFGTANVLMFNPPGPLCNSSNVYLNNFYWQWGSTYRGSANITTAPTPLCHSGADNGVCSATLPIDLAYFKGRKESNGILLEWMTYTELNNDFFFIEKSADGKTWIPVAEVQGAGNSGEEIEYTFVDERSSGHEAYYRLTQVDFDGSKEIFEVITIGDSNEGEGLKIYPNPADNFFSLGFDAETVEIISASGEIVDSHANVQPTQQIDISNLNSGFYIINVKRYGLVSSAKLAKK